MSALLRRVHDLQGVSRLRSSLVKHRAARQLLRRTVGLMANASSPRHVKCLAGASLSLGSIQYWRAKVCNPLFHHQRHGGVRWFKVPPLLRMPILQRIRLLICTRCTMCLPELTVRFPILCHAPYIAQADINRTFRPIYGVSFSRTYVHHILREFGWTDHVLDRRKIEKWSVANTLLTLRYIPWAMQQAPGSLVYMDESYIDISRTNTSSLRDH